MRTPLTAGGFRYPVSYELLPDPFVPFIEGHPHRCPGLTPEFLHHLYRLRGEVRRKDDDQGLLKGVKLSGDIAFLLLG
ncbi:MAG: hypothetical protein DRG32_01275 [Deltaproteobacteria bacterium]|nr:MAG: hypothetical protein DRG32_01275 [Deltaproteobacteria bacterium]